MKFTKRELVEQWLKRYPNDANCPDLEFNAVAGYVECQDGKFMLYREWEAEMQENIDWMSSFCGAGQ